MKRRTLVGAVIVTLALLAGVALGQELRVDYAGELIDGSARPLGGVFTLRFKLFRDAGASDPIWEEQHYVAVSDGEYQVELGDQNPIDPSLVGQELYVSVEFMDQELLREPLVLQAAAPSSTGLPLDGVVTNGEGQLTQVTFAQLADRAIVADSADQARDCERLAGRSLAEIDRYDELIQRIAELEERLSRESRSGSATIGSSTTVLQRVGGEGGTRYTRMCPAGYVVVGTRGAAGGFVDSMELVCAPLE